MIHAPKRLSASLLIVAIFVLGFRLPIAQAAMVSTAELSHATSLQSGRDRLTAFLDRTDVQQRLQTLGVDPAQAKARVASLTDPEVKMLNGKIQQLPAGGDGFVGAILGTGLLLFIILLITDILGFTDVFGFVNHHALRQ